MTYSLDTILAHKSTLELAIATWGLLDEWFDNLQDYSALAGRCREENFWQVRSRVMSQAGGVLLRAERAFHEAIPEDCA